MRRVFIVEPPARWVARPKLVVDASLLAASLFRETQHEAAEAQMNGRSLCAPALIDYEIANVALSKIRSRTISAEDAARALSLYVTLDIERFDADPVATVRIGESFGLTAYDAAYLWVAGQLRAPIATFDARVAVAAKAYLKQLPAP